jgi:cobalt-zinc-cadmium efflux system outer membrane protein
MRRVPDLVSLVLAGALAQTAIVRHSGAEPAPPSAPQAITLDEAISEALASAPDIAAAAETAVQARADLRTASLFPNPDLTVGTTLQHLPGGHYTQTNPGGPPQSNVDVSHQIDTLLFGKRAAAIESAKRAVDTADADFADQKRRRAGDVAAAFFDVAEARALLDLSRQDLANLQRVESLTQSRVQLGASAAIDLDRARLAVATSQQDLRTAETTVLTARASLKSLLGRRSADPGFDVAGTLDVPSLRQPAELEPLLASAEQVRVDLVSLRRQVEHWEAELKSQSRQAFPTVSFQLGYLYQHQEPIGLRDLNEWEGSFTTSLPLFDRNQGNIAKAESEVRQARHSLEAARASLRAELDEALSAFRAAHSSVLADDPAQLQAARSVRDRMEAAYKAGGRTILELLDAEKAYRDAMRLHVHAQSSYWHALYRVDTAAGAPIGR